MKIQQLAPIVIKKLRSDVAFTSIAHCIEELVWNAIDADASCIAVRLNLPFYRIQVVDNGNGISPDDMKLVGTRYATSKCHSLEDLENLKYGGFRGEALSSLKEVSSVLMIESRSAGSDETYCKIFTKGISSKPKRSNSSRPSKGTTVTVLDFMYNMPVRRSTISEALDLEDTRKLLQSIALVHPGISFSLQNEAIGEICFQFKKCSSIYNAFIQLFGKSKAENLKHIQEQFDEYEIQGYLSTDSYFSKDLQFLYVNQRLVLKTKIHKLINNTLKRALFTKQLSKLDILDSPSPSKNNLGKNQIQYGIFVLNILCPYSKYDAIFDRQRTIIEFKDSDKISKLVERALLNFLKKEKLVCISEEENKLQPSNITFNPNEITDSYNYKNGLFSHAAKRLNTISVPPEASRSASTNEDSHPVESISLHPARNNESVYTKSLFAAENASSLPTNSTRFEYIASNGNKLNQDPNDKKGIQNVKQSRAGQNLITLKQGTTNGSILDGIRLKCKVTSISDMNNNINNNVINSLGSSSAEILDIPCRSVFPTKSPIMLRAPAKSTLSLLQKKYPQSDALLKLKEKYQFVPNKSENKSSSIQNHQFCVELKNCNNACNDNKNNCKETMESRERPITSSFKNISHQNFISNLSCYDAQETKSFQYTPVVSESQSKVLSKYSFKNEPKPLALQKLSRSNKVGAKSLTKNLRLDRDIIDNSNESDVSKTKKIKYVVENFPDHNMCKHHSVTNEVIKSADSVYSFENSSFSKNFNGTDGGLKFYSHESNHINANNTIRSKNMNKSNLITDQYNTFLLQTFTVTDKSNDSQNNNTLSNTSHSNYFPSRVFCPELSKDSVSECRLKSQTDCELISPEVCISNSATVESEVQVFVKEMKNIARDTEIETKHLNSSHSISINKQNVQQNLSKIHNEKLSNSSEARYSNCDNNCAYTEEHFNTHEICNKECILPVSESRSLVTRAESEFDLETSPIIPLQHKNAVNHAFNTDNKEFSSMVQCSDVYEIRAPSAETGFAFKSYSVLNSVEEFIPVVQGISNDNNFSYPSQTDFDIRNEKLLIKDNSADSDYLEAEFEYDKFNGERSVVSKDKCEPSSDIQKNIQACHATELSLVNKRLEVESADYPDKPSLCSSKSVVNKHPYESQNKETEIIREVPCLEEGDDKLNVDEFCESLKEQGRERESSVNVLNIPEQNNCVYVPSADRKNKKPQCNDFINYIASAESSLNNEMRSNETNSTNTLIVKSFENKSSQTVTDSKINSVDEKTASDKLIGNMEISSRWVCQTDPETKRVTYIDTITGNSSFFMPEQKELDETKESVSGHFEKGHFFLSHDFSPFMPKKSSPSLTEDVSMSHLQTELTDFVENKEKKEWNCKWRDNKQESSSSDSNVEEMFNKWENPIFNISSEANCTEDASVSRKVPQMYGILNSYRFSKSTLQTLQVIGQVDCKFIACVLQDFNNGCNDQMLLALFDQHAVHERIRLEELSEELYETAENGERRIKSVPITPSLRITLESEEVRLLHAYHIHLQQIGVRLSLNNDSNVIDVYSIPAIFIEKETKELRKKLPEVSSLVEKLIREWLTSLIQTRSLSYIMPKTLSSVLNSQACRGAVKFGDPLSLSQCENLLNSLSNCKLPFQCAHGRPSIAPILDIKKIDALCKKRLPPKLESLSLRMSNNLL